MDDDNSMSERILRSIESIFINDPEVKEFSIVPSEDNSRNKSPVLFEEHCIGLESWCVKRIYKFAYLELFEIRHLLGRKKLPYDKIHNVNYLLIGVLLINPDVTTFWNMKRELVEHDVVSIEKELIFTKVVLSHKHKSNATFTYRKWLLERVISKLRENDLTPPAYLLDNEFHVTEMIGRRTPNNYHAWNHRIWAVENMANDNANLSQIVLNELEFSYEWISTHVSEHTGYYYRQFLFKLVKHNRNITTIFDAYYNYVVIHLELVNENDPRNILLFLLGKHKSQQKSVEESNKYLNYICLLLFDLFHTVDHLNSFYYNHESLWYHRRFLLYHIVQTAYDYHSLTLKSNIKIDLPHSIKTDTNIVNSNEILFDVNDSDDTKELVTQLNKVKSSFLYQWLVKNESNFINSTCNGSRLIQMQYAKKYETWLTFVVSFDKFH